MEQLYKAWLDAKNDEQQANTRRIEIEKRILDAVRNELPEEGSKTINDGRYKLSVGMKVTRSLDEDRWHDIIDHIPPDMSPVTVVEKFKLDDSGCRWLKDNRPDLWTIAAQAITEKPAKPSIKIEVRDV